MPAQHDSRSVVLHAVTLIDGTGAPSLEDQCVVVVDGRIEQVGPSADVPHPPGVRVVDVDGQVVTPGFIDVHAHLPADEAVRAAMLHQFLEYGVTTILNPGARPGAGLETRDALQSGLLDGPRFLTAGPIIDGLPVTEGLEGWSSGVGSVEAIEAEVDRQAAMGVDVIKLYRNLAPALVAAAVQRAHAHGVRVVGHMGRTSWAEAAALGIDMLVHSGFGRPMNELVYLDDVAGASDDVWYRAWAAAAGHPRFAEHARTLQRAGVVVAPTLAITLASSRKDTEMLPRFRTDLAPDADIEDWWTPGWDTRHPQFQPDSPEEADLVSTILFPGALAVVSAYHRAGVRLAIGSDVGNSWMTPGVSYHLELELFQEAGIAPLDILRMATSGGASALGIETQVGAVRPGMAADLLVFALDPSEDIRHTQSLVSVYQGGREIARSAAGR